MKKEKTACTGLKCPLKNYCEHYRNHVLKNTKTYFMAEFDAESKKCRNFKYLDNGEKQNIITIKGKKIKI